MRIYIILISIILNVPITLFSQITIAETDGTPLTDGDIRIYNTDGDEADLKLILTNNDSKKIEVKARCESITGASGEGMSFCVYNCYSGMSAGKEYPLDPAQFFLNAGESSGTNEVHFHHINLTGDPDATTYVLKIFEVGNEANNSITFTYKYDTNYSSIDFVEQKQILYPNPASNYITIRKITGAKFLSIKNILGKELYFSAFFEETMRVNLSKYKTGIYFCTFSDENSNPISSKKIVKQ